MAPPPGALQRAVLVAVPLALVVLVFVTPILMGRVQSPTSIPSFVAGVARERWNGTYNETALLYVQSALGVAVYDYIAINATGVGNYTATRWSTNGTRVPSLWLKFPVNATRVANVSAVATDQYSVYRFNGTIEFRFDRGWIVRVTLERQTSSSDYSAPFTTPMRREARP